MERTIITCDGLHGMYLPAAKLFYRQYNWTQVNDNLDPDGPLNYDQCPECSVSQFIISMMKIFHGWEDFGIMTKIYPQGLTYEMTQEAGKANFFSDAREI